MTPNQSALEDLISAFGQADTAAWERAASRLHKPEATMIAEIFERYPYPGPAADAAESPAVIRLMEQGTAEFLELRNAGERMHSGRLRRSMRESVNGMPAAPAQAPAPPGASPAAPVADFGPGI